jgi:GAF domain-containing protein
MAEGITLPSTKDRTLLFEALIPQVDALLEGETDLIAAMANVAAAIHDTFGWHWVGFYRVVGQELVLGPFQGPVACARIPFGKGVCGTAWKEDRTLVVPDVDLFPGHIACSALSRSEVVVPIHDGNGKVVAVLDIDSSLPDDISEADATCLERICRSLASIA